MSFTKKQTEYLLNATKVWNNKEGAVRAGKTYIDYYVLPKKLQEQKGKKGFNVLVGYSLQTINQNLIYPMRDIFGERMIGSVKPSQGTVELFGHTFNCVGAGKVSAVARIQGMSIKLLIGDEVTKWNEDFFNMLLTRLDKPYSYASLSENPEQPTHWFRKFLIKEKDYIFNQHYTIDDNPNLNKETVERIKRQLFGTVLYDRYVLGLWKRAEGAIYRAYADNPERYRGDAPKRIENFVGYRSERNKLLTEINIGLDFGGSKSAHAICASGLSGDGKLYALKSDLLKGSDGENEIDVDELCNKVLSFVNDIVSRWGKVDHLFFDSAEVTLGRQIKKRIEEKFHTITVRGSKKEPIKERIKAEIILLNEDRLIISDECDTLSTALQEAVWNDKADDERLDNGTSDIDSLDAFEYSCERWINKLIKWGSV